MQHNSYKYRGLLDTEKDEPKSPLPYSLKQLRVKNFYGIEETSISGIPLDAQWIFLTGENGFGKTILLQALAIGLFGDRDGNTILTGDQDHYEIRVEIQQKGKTIINIPGHQDHFKQFTGFVAYGSSRLSIQTAHTLNKISEQSNTTYGLFNTDGVLLNIEYEFLKWYLKKDPRFEKVKKTLLRLLPHERHPGQQKR